MKKHHDTKNSERNDNRNYSDSSTAKYSPEIGKAAYEEPKIEEPVKYSMCAGCDDCGAYYNES